MVHPHPVPQNIPQSSGDLEKVAGRRRAISGLMKIHMDLEHGLFFSTRREDKTVR
jgi:hypothetical protein